MKSLPFLLLLLFCFISCAHMGRSPASVKPKKHVVYDIDWSITSEVKPEFVGKRIIEVEGKRYFVHEGLEDFVEDLLQKGIHVSFYSGGGRSRNHILLEKIKLSDGRSLKDIAYKILSKEDLIAIDGVSADARFSQRFKKDLTKVSSDLSNLVMLDDTPHFVLNQKQEEHVLVLGKSFLHFEKFSDAKLASGDYVPRTYGEWSLNKEKLKVLHGAFNQAYLDSLEKGISWSEAVKNQEKLLDFSTGEWNDHSRLMFKNIRPLMPASMEGNSCFGLANSLIQNVQF